MMDDTKLSDGRTIQGAAASMSDSGGEPAVTPPASPEAPAVSAAVERFRSCRWRSTPDAGEFCTHRDVLPFAGKEGFVADSWCPECAYYKLRRTPKKRERVDYSY